MYGLCWQVQATNSPTPIFPIVMTFPIINHCNFKEILQTNPDSGQHCTAGDLIPRKTVTYHFGKNCWQHPRYIWIYLVILSQILPNNSDWSGTSTPIIFADAFLLGSCLEVLMITCASPWHCKRAVTCI